MVWCSVVLTSSCGGDSEFFPNFCAMAEAVPPVSALTLLCVLILFQLYFHVPNVQGGDFLLIPLGTAGGNQESNLSSFALSTTSSATSNPGGWINFDAGNLLSGLTLVEPLLAPYVNHSVGLRTDFNFLKVSISFKILYSIGR